MSKLLAKGKICTEDNQCKGCCMNGVCENKSSYGCKNKLKPKKLKKTKPKKKPKLTMKDLKKMCDEKGIKYKSSLKKADLEKLCLTKKKSIKKTPTPKKSIKKTPTPKKSIKKSPTPKKSIKKSPTPKVGVDDDIFISELLKDDDIDDDLYDFGFEASESLNLEEDDDNFLESDFLNFIEASESLKVVEDDDDFLELDYLNFIGEYDDIEKPKKKTPTPKKKTPTPKKKTPTPKKKTPTPKKKVVIDTDEDSDTDLKSIIESLKPEIKIIKKDLSKVKVIIPKNTEYFKKILKKIDKLTNKEVDVELKELGLDSDIEYLKKVLLARLENML